MSAAGALLSSSRVTAVYRLSDYPGAPDAATRAGLAELFGRMFPGVAEPEIARDHAGIAIAEFR